jgi:predicted Rossmann fold nucleotide-binding protein DprA/Smf involved in DNA uptake
MNNNSTVIVLLCSHLCANENLKPFSPSEWSVFACNLLACRHQPHDLLSFSNDDFQSKLNLTPSEALRIKRLLDRNGSITFAIEKYANMGINILTRADDEYPQMLKAGLGKSCPPIFYYAGNPTIASYKCIGFVGSRDICEDDDYFTAISVTKANKKGYSIVSGGAKGVDKTSATSSILNGSNCVEYISDSLISKIKSKDTLKAIINNQLLIMTAVTPESRFSVGVAMMRNKFIYAQSEGTVIVKSDYKKGGTWAGAVENLKLNLSTSLCWNKREYKGNVELINRGMIPIDETWDGNKKKKTESTDQVLVQTSLFDFVTQ